LQRSPNPVETRDHGAVAYILGRFVNQQEIEAAIERAAQALAPMVVRIRYNFGPDWEGEPSIFFRIVLSDESARKPKFSDTAQTVAVTVMNEAHTDEQGLHAYFEFRSLSDQDQINEPAWA
jgi:hypothetical protein